MIDQNKEKREIIGMQKVRVLKHLKQPQRKQNSPTLTKL